MTEVERKFLLTDPPELGDCSAIRQGYVAVDGSVELRVRAVDGDRHLLTVKGGKGIERTEVELAIDRAQFDELWPLAAGRRLEKARHRVPVGEHTAEVDVYAGDLAGLLVVEVEFASIEDAGAFEPPAWFGREVTDEPGWSNAALAAHGRPDRPRAG